jgi:hypothetical protein
MKKILSLLLALGFVAQVHAQIRGAVLDATTNAPLAYATILIKGTAKGTFAQADGSFLLNEANKGDTLQIRMLGYEQTEYVPAAAVVTIVLQSKTQTLEALTITAAERKKGKERLTVGYHKASKDLYKVLVSKWGYSIVVKLNNPRKTDGILAELHLKLKNPEKKRTRCRLHVLAVDLKTGEPSQSLLHKDIVFDLSNNLGDFNIKLDDVILPAQGAWIGIEVLGEVEQGQLVFPKEGFRIKIAFSKNDEKVETYARFIGSKFYKHSVPPSTGYSNAMFGATIFY